MKTGTIQEDLSGGFALQYEDTLGRVLEMRLEATSYEGALKEARAYLSIDKEGIDPAGDTWNLE